MLVGMDVLVPIGEFSKMTHLSVKALRHYHDIGLLEPTDIDRHSGYRRYSPAQAPAAQAIRRFRDLDMPLDGIRAVLTAPDPAAREAAILEHLRRIEDDRVGGDPDHDRLAGRGRLHRGGGCDGE